MSRPGFELTDGAGGRRGFDPAERSVVCFVKQDCPTCTEILPAIETLRAHFGERLPFLIVGQDPAGNRELEQRFALAVPLLDDADLTVSFDWELDIVPTLFVTGGTGEERVLTGFEREEWQALAAALSGDTGLPEPDVDWQALPAWRPGCGSRSADPMIAERLAARASGSPLRARRIEVASADDPHEFLFDQGMTDGLPVVPPTPERVMRMLAGTARDAQDVVAVVPPNLAEATVEKVAINAVMAGCRPEHLPVVIAALEAACTDRFNAHGVMSTTMGASPVMVVNGPIRHRLGMNMKLGALGQGHRANATIGRALRLVLRNVGGARPGGTERSTLGNPMKFTMCFAEWEERSPWSPLHVERGFEPTDSVISLFAMTSGPVQIVDQESRSASQLAGTMGQCLESAFSPQMHYVTDTLLVVCPEHLDTLTRDGWGKGELRARIQEITARPVRDLVENDRSGTGFRAAAAAQMSPEDLDKRLPKFRRDEDIHIVVAGSDAGKFSGAFHGWAIGEIGSQSVSVKIEEVT